MKLEEGMYIRRIGIFKINTIEDFNSREYKINGFYMNKKDIKKASYNIIDLLEVGDIITFKEDEDVYKILQIPNEKCGLKDFYLVKNFDGETEDIFVKYDYMKEYINSIVTKEKFEIMQYKVVE